MNKKLINMIFKTFNSKTYQIEERVIMVIYFSEHILLVYLNVFSHENH